VNLGAVFLQGKCSLLTWNASTLRNAAGGYARVMAEKPLVEILLTDTTYQFASGAYIDL